MKKVIVIGSGFAGLSAAAYLSKEGFDVTVVEKNKQIGGRARNFKAKGYTFDMGPSWYWMPEIFDNFFHSFNHTTKDFYELKQKHSELERDVERRISSLMYKVDKGIE